MDRTVYSQQLLTAFHQVNVYIIQVDYMLKMYVDEYSAVTDLTQEEADHKVKNPRQKQYFDGYY